MLKYPILHYIKEVKDKLGFSKTLNPSIGATDVIDAVNKQSSQIDNLNNCFGQLHNDSSIVSQDTFSAYIVNLMSNIPSQKTIFATIVVQQTDGILGSTQWSGYLTKVTGTRIIGVFDAITVGYTIIYKYNNGSYTLERTMYKAQNIETGISGITAKLSNQTVSLFLNVSNPSQSATTWVNLGALPESLRPSVSFQTLGYINSDATPLSMQVRTDGQVRYYHFSTTPTIDRIVGVITYVI